MNKIFISSDLHLNHERIREYCPRYRSKYQSTQEMTNGIIETWNSIISSEDVCYLLGDFALGQTKYHIELLEKLQGQIKICPGNHDKFICKKKDLLPLHVEILPKIYNLTINLSEGQKQTFVLCHYPIDDWEGRAEHSGREPRTGYRMLHGHVHGNRGAETAPGRWDVGFDVWGQPMPIEFFAERK